MPPLDDTDLRKQLTDSRASIRAQLDAIADRRRYHYRRAGGPPDFDPAEVALTDQLREIEELLENDSDGGDPDFQP